METLDDLIDSVFFNMARGGRNESTNDKLADTRVNQTFARQCKSNQRIVKREIRDLGRERQKRKIGRRRLIISLIIRYVQLRRVYSL